MQGDLVNHDVVSQKDGKRFVSNQCLGYENGMPQPQRLLLANRRYGDHPGDLLHYLQEILLSLFPEPVFQSVVVIEVVLDLRFTTAGNEGNLS